MIRKPIAVLTLIYGLLVFVLGIMGYRVSNSLPSLIFGSGLGALTTLSAILMLMEKKFACFLGLIFSILLGVVFGFRFNQTNGFMPGAMALFSAIIAVSLIIQIYRLNEKM